MIWLAWRRRRGAIVATIAVLLVVGLLMLLTGRQMTEAFDEGGMRACLDRLDGAAFVPFDGGCQEQAEAFASRFFTLRLLGLALFLVAPLLVGMFWGAPIVARELEQDTASLVWTQGVPRRRWVLAEVGVTGVMVLVTMGVVAALVTWWYGPLNAATGDRFQWLIYDQQGLVPVGYALFAMALGAMLGAVTRRTNRAMALTVLGFLVVRFGVAVWARPRLAAPVERTYPVLGDLVPNRLHGDWIYGGGGPGVGVVLSATGERIAGGQRVCPPPDPECVLEVGRGAYNLELIHPADRFWTFQTLETATFVAVAVVLVVLTAWWVRRRLA